MKLTNVRILAIGSLLASGAAFADATPPDFTTLTTAVDFSTVATAILAIAGLKVAPKVVMWGAGVVLRMIGR